MIQGQQPSVSQVRTGGPGCIVTGLWFVLVGWWLSALWIGIAWALNVTIIGLPLGLIMINKLPLIVSLRPETTQLTITPDRVLASPLDQYPLVVRAIYFLLIGWWLSGFWMAVAWAASITIVGLPLAIWMYNRVPAVTTLRRY